MWNPSSDEYEAEVLDVPRQRKRDRGAPRNKAWHEDGSGSGESDEGWDIEEMAIALGRSKRESKPGEARESRQQGREARRLAMGARSGE